MKKQNRNKTISVVMCTYNGELFLHAQIDSIINQTYSIQELIICDDCSTDQTVEIANEYKVKYPFIQLICNSTRLGVRKNFEQAIQQATSNYIALADQDDIWEIDKIAILMDYITSVGVALVHSDVCLIDATGNKFSAEHDFKKPDNLTLNDYIFKQNNVTGCTCLFDAKLKQKLSPFPRFYFYHDQWIAIVACRNGGIAWVNSKLIRYRQHANNTLSTFEGGGGGGKQKSLNQISFINKAKDLLLILSKSDDINLSLKIRCKLYMQIVSGIIGFSYLRYKLLGLSRTTKTNK